MTNDLFNRLKRLQSRLCDMRVIPFLGAGVSQKASHSEDGDFKPTVQYMKDKLYKRFKKEFKGESPNNGGNNEDILLNKLDKLIDSSKDNLDRISEVCEWLLGHEEVCNTIEIDKFAGLKPLPAHRFLAYLAREGLITEIITTNYDCCIENAFINTFGPSRINEGRDAHVCITDLAEYRKYGGRRFTRSSPRRSILHIFKINGCAGRYTAEGLHERIILTERQLQSFRNENWAKDLFRDRARSHTLVFSGFGSEEPQVRHTALNIIREFRAISSSPHNSLTPEEISELPNAPFIASCAHLSFTQMQILDAFMTAHKPCLSGMERIKAAELNGFSENDADYIGDKKAGSPCKLSADIFWRWVYLLGFSCLFYRFTEDGSAFLKWLDYHNVPAKMWRGFLRNALYPEETGPDSLDALFGNIRVLLDFEEGRPEGPLILWQWLAVMKYPDEPINRHDWYLPVTEDPLLVLITLLFLAALTGADRFKKISEHVQPRKGIGLEVQLKPLWAREAEANEENRPETMRSKMIYIVSQANCGTREQDAGDQRKYPRLIRRIAIPSLRYLDRERQWNSVSPSENNTIRLLRVGYVVTVEAGDLIHEAQTPERLPKAVLRRAASDRPPKNSRVVALENT